MGARMVREVLNRLRWHPEGSDEDVAIGYLVRDEGGERVELVRLAAVAAILPAGVILRGDTFVPYHRLRFVRRGEASLWDARTRRNGDED